MKFPQAFSLILFAHLNSSRYLIDPPKLPDVS
jgi:hypothetical protein